MLTFFSLSGGHMLSTCIMFYMVSMTQHMYIFFLFLMFHLWFCPISLDVNINLYQCQYQCQCQCHGRPQEMRQEKTIAPPPTLDKSSKMFLRVWGFFSLWGVFFSMWVDFFLRMGPFSPRVEHLLSLWGQGRYFLDFPPLTEFLRAPMGRRSG